MGRDGLLLKIQPPFLLISFRFMMPCLMCIDQSYISTSKLLASVLYVLIYLAVLAVKPRTDEEKMILDQENL